MPGSGNVAVVIWRKREKLSPSSGSRGTGKEAVSSLQEELWNLCCCWWWWEIMTAQIVVSSHCFELVF